MAFLAGLIGELGTGAAATGAAAGGTEAAVAGTAARAGAGEALSGSQFGQTASKAADTGGGIGNLLSLDNLNPTKAATSAVDSVKSALTNDYGRPSLDVVGDRLRNLSNSQFG